MGQVLPRSMSPTRIFEDFDSARKEGARRAAVKATVAARLDPLVPIIEGAQAEVAAGVEDADDKERDLLAFDGQSDLEIGAVLDEVWNALGRPASSTEYSLIAGTGKGQWCDGDPRDQAGLMSVLAKRIRQTTAPALQDKKEAWAKRIEDKAAPQAAAAQTLRAAEASLAIARGMERAVADLAQVALTRLKRDLKNEGLTETQVHEIIPDYDPKSKKPAAKPADKPADKPTDTPASPTTPAQPAAPKP